MEYITYYGLGVLLIAVITAIVLEIIILSKLNKSAGNPKVLENTEDILLNMNINKQIETERNTQLQKSFSDLNSKLNDNKEIINKTLSYQHIELMRSQIEQQDKLYNTLNNQSNKITAVLSETVGKLQESNEKKLEEMRVTVDEKLTSTLTQRLDSSFKVVGEQLQSVYKSLGEMKDLSNGVSDLQKLLTNVKARGTWAEVQLGEILEEILTNEQFERNVSIKNNGEVVEYAVKIPSRDEEGTYVYLPIDSKFPQEDYLRLQDAANKCDKAGVEECAKALERIVKNEAALIAKLYINVPKTTDFAIMFLPTEGLYAEVLRRPGLVEELQRKYRIMVCGPTTITAFLNTLKIGFRTIALDKRAADVWKILGAAKQQYESFGFVLEKAKRKINEAGNVIEDAQKRNTIIQKKLRTVETLEQKEAEQILELTDINIQ